MRLTKSQRHLLEGGSDAQRQAMRILLALAKLSDADRLIPVTGAHVSGASYKMIGDPGLGARPHRESGPSALAAAIVGATPEYGLHLDEGRRPTVVVNAPVRPRDLDFSLIGLVAGERVGDGLPFFRGFRGSESDLKWLGAALASSGSCGMFLLEGVTPEARRASRRGLPSISITRKDLDEARWQH